MNDKPRYQQILSLLDEIEICSIEYLAKQFSVSQMTIRRDIKKLQERGLIQVNYGGRLKKSFMVNSPLYNTKEAKHHQSKQIIGQLASQLIQPNMYIFMDGGTTVREMIAYIHVPITVVTLDLSIAMLLNDKPEVRLILCPGEVTPKSRACYNSETIKYLSSQLIDMAFIGADGFSLVDGALSTTQIKADCKWSVMQRAVQSVLLVDNSKLKLRCRHQITELSQFSYIITEQQLPQAWQNELQQRGVTLLYSI